MRNPPIGKHQ
jgi:hypothetical protein